VIARAESISEESRNLRLQRSKTRLTGGIVGTINCTPMIDIIFNLLIYFLCVGLMHIPEGALPARLPSTHGQAQPTLPVSPIEVYLEQGPVPDSVLVQMRPQASQLTGMLDLYDQMKALAANRNFGVDAPVILVPARDVRLEFVADAYNAAYQAGFKQIVFGEKPE